MSQFGVSIIVPTLNEAGSIERLIRSIHRSLSQAKIAYEVIVVDDHSTDETRSIVNELSLTYPIRVELKQGQKGKAHSLVEGLRLAQYELVAMIDGDLQYPPEAIPAMVKKFAKPQIGLVVARRKEKNVSWLRRMSSWGFQFVFGRLLHRLKCDVQSGLKIFRKEIGVIMPKDGLTGWTFDIPLLLTAVELGYEIDEVKITFAKRLNGESKIQLLKSSWEIGKNALEHKLRKEPLTLLPRNEGTMLGAGVVKKRKRFVTHTTLDHKQSALTTFTAWQKVTIVSLLLLLVYGLVKYSLVTAIVFVAILSCLYFVDVIFNLWLVWKSLHQPPEIAVSEEELRTIRDARLPKYTILCPLYRESQVLPHFLESIEKIDWPKEKLDVILLLEEDDEETIAAVNEMALPGYVRARVVPHSEPKTKPKACNYGLNFAQGEYLVIYDAEDAPDPLQLKKVYLAFKKAASEVKCIQAKLNYHNSHQNLLTRFFTAEYSLWFDVILTGLQTANTVIPLGGTSNHFRTDDLREFKGWDPFNVTEDADLGVRLFKNGGRTAIIDSLTLEEANSRLGNWLRQRSRWIKGYMQTYLVHMRHPLRFVKNHGWHAAFFHLSIGGKILFLLINPLMWLLTFSYFGLYALVGPTIEKLYPTVIFYLAAFSLVFGNFMFIYYYMIGAAKREHWSLMKYVFLVPLYWLAASTAAGIALYQLVVKPHYWEKTVHGLHLGKKAIQQRKEVKIEVQVEEKVEEQIEEQRWRLKPGVVSAGALVMASVIANGCNFLYNAYLGRRLGFLEFGVVSLYSNLFYVAQSVLTAVSATVTHKAAYLLGKNEKPAVGFWKLVRKKTFFASFVIAGLWLAATPWLKEFFQTESLLPFILFTPILLLGGVWAVDQGYLSGNLRFASLAVIIVLTAVTKLAVSAGLVEGGLAGWVYIAIPGSMAVAMVPAWWQARKLTGSKIEVSAEELKFDWQFCVNSLLRGLSMVSFLSLDVILVKHFMDPVEAGKYALISLVGKMIFFVGFLFVQFMIPMVSKAEGEGKGVERVFLMLMLPLAVTTVAAYVSLGLLGEITIPILLGEKARVIVKYLPVYGLAMTAFTVASAIVVYYQARKVYVFTWLSVLLTVSQVVVIWRGQGSLEQVVEGMTVVGLGVMGLSLGLHLIYPRLKIWSSNLMDFLGLFGRLGWVAEERQGDNYRILFLNWRDTKHVWAGGAEVYVHELAKGLIEKGHKVTVFCGNDGKSERHEVIDGVQIVRRGGFYTVYVWSMLYYLFRFRGKFDVVVDCENGVPFFTPVYVRVPKFLVIHHVHQEIFREHLPTPLATVAMMLEKRVMPSLYRNTQAITVSESSKKAIMRHGLSRRQPVVIHSGVDLNKYLPAKKAERPLVLYVGRLKAYKNIATLLKAVKVLSHKKLEIRLVIAGQGEELSRLQAVAKQLGIERMVEFKGKVTEEEKVRLYQRAWVAVNPSTMEGWGITSIEANACATPVVASDVPGLRDSVRNPHTGYLVQYNDPEAFAERIFRIISNRRLREDLGRMSREWAKQFTWKRAVKNFLEVIGND